VQLNHRSAEAVVLQILSQIGEVSTVQRGAGDGVDLLLTTNEGVVHRVEVKGFSSLSPAAVRRTAAPRRDADLSVAVAPRISAATAQELERSGWSWASLDDQAHLRAPGILVRSVRVEPSPVVATTIPSPLTWTDASRDVAERILAHIPPDWIAEHPLPLPTTAVIADETGHSQSRVAAVIRGMAARGWVRKEGGQRGIGSRWTVVDPTALLDEWVEHQKPPREILAHGLVDDPGDFAAGRLAPVLPPGRWALAGTSAAERLAPVLTAAPVLEVAVAADLMPEMDRLLFELRLRPVDRGHRVRFVAARSATMRTIQVVDDLPVTSDVRTYADLVNRPGRGADAAAEIRRTRLAF
jgi:hypothetical protein